jgi:glycosyltransferase involved in cell wall biosynthesis
MPLIRDPTQPGACRPLVSIVTPSLNQGRFIEDTIESIRSQTYPNIEHIIVDGGSTDDTAEVVGRHVEGYRLEFIQGSDSGMYDAVNKGLARAQGEILAYLNSDDQYFPWSVEAAVSAFEAAPDAGFVFGDMLNADHGSSAGGLAIHPPFRLRHMLGLGRLSQPTVFWRREVDDQIGRFDASLKFAADHEYWVRMGRHFPGVRIDEVLAIERNHPASKRATENELRLAELRLIRDRHAGRVWPWTVLADHAYAGLWRRYLLARLAWTHRAIRRDGPGSVTRWGSFLTLARPRFDRRALAGVFVPLLGRRTSRRLVSFTPPSRRWTADSDGPARHER